MKVDVASPPQSFYQRHPGWTVLGALAMGGVIGYAIHGDGEDHYIRLGAPPPGGDDDDDDDDDCRRPRGRTKGWK